MFLFCFFFFKQKTAYEMRISDWSSDVCSSDLVAASLQRLPGVSIQRSGARGEPQGITVRGFGGDFNETLYDGRRISTATGGRSVDFCTVGAYFVGTLSVLPTSDVSLLAIPLAATLNADFTPPFHTPSMPITA